MRKAVEAVMAQYGTDMTIGAGEDQKTVRGFFRAVSSKSWLSMEAVASPLGEISRGQYAYMGPVGTEVREGDVLTLGGRSYLFRRVEAYYYQNAPVYIWGLCVEKGVNELWESRS